MCVYLYLIGLMHPITPNFIYIYTYMYIYIYISPHQQLLLLLLHGLLTTETSSP